MTREPPAPPDDETAGRDNGNAAGKTYPVEEGARRLRKSRAWYLRQLRAGLLPGHRAGRTWFLTERDIDQALEQTAQPANGSPPSATEALGQSSAQKLTQAAGLSRRQRRHRLPPPAG
ncbi:helix-turn-helix domain-containing protein [Nocardia sp. NBC_00565]|uniref:helix-turn-helix domain-containing protein n=1 Tax=Nocardia sp. NBC_00565 TaxID=2975993 RepID=UPI002E8020EE|nr:helix-turn-helix domain-containing protein [Nocardia sp. NBC_00565]WUC02065.1 helix-turn-helix domain-containing protein [Nocardia sp. NBC_00565]